MSPPEIREASFASRLVTKSIVFLPYKYFPDFRWWFINSSQTTYEGRGFGRYLGGQNRKRIFEKTRVGFGRTELSLRLSWTEFCALSSGHGPRGEGFYGGSSRVDFHVFQGGQKSAKKIVYTSQKKIPLTIGKWFLDDFKRCQNSAKKIVYTSQKKYHPWPSENGFWMILRGAKNPRKK